MLLGDSNPLSFVTEALFTENPLSEAALLWDSVSAALGTKLRCSYFFPPAVSTNFYQMVAQPANSRSSSTRLSCRRMQALQITHDYICQWQVVF